VKEIIITTSQEELLSIEKIIPKPAYKDIPKHFKKMPSNVERGAENFPNLRTAKHCPSFIDIYKEGIIIYAHTDMFVGSKGDGEFYWEVPPNNGFYLEHHSDNQFVDYYPNSKVKQVFKIPSPFELIVPRGYSVRQVPLIYDYNPDWHIAYGVYEADKNQEIVLQLMYTSDKEHVLIESGTPLCYLLPFKREKYSYKVKKYSNKFKTKYSIEKAKLQNSFVGNYNKNIKGKK
tara:strand:+ start:1186 stop:1881 length:696 start_codon:yes stop_codon:yes gene_type:complete